MSPAPPTPDLSPSPPRRFAAILNPRGGRQLGLKVLSQVQPLFNAAGASLDVHVTRAAGHATELAQTLDLDATSGLLVIGGDGTLHETVNGLMRRADPARVPLGVIPGGTGNAVAAHLGLADPADAARRILAGAVQPLDVARVTTPASVAFCVNIIGWGFVVDVNRTAERLRWLRESRYNVAALWRILRARHRRARLTFDGRVLEDDFLFLVACNTKFTGKGMLLAPHAEMGDGLLDVILARRATRLGIFRMLSHVFDGSHLSLPGVECHRVRAFSIQPQRHDRLNLDGEIAGATPVSVELLPSPLRIFA